MAIVCCVTERLTGRMPKSVPSLSALQAFHLHRDSAFSSHALGARLVHKRSLE